MNERKQQQQEKKKRKQEDQSLAIQRGPGNWLQERGK